VEVRTAERRPTAMWTAFHVATVAMTFADRRAAVRAWAEFRIHLGLQCNRMTSSTLLIPELHWPSATPCSASAPLLHCNTRLKSTRLGREPINLHGVQLASVRYAPIATVFRRAARCRDGPSATNVHGRVDHLICKSKAQQGDGQPLMVNGRSRRYSAI
jgi:hypothetical protein